METNLVAYRIETTLTKDNTLILEKLPYMAGDRVEVIVLPTATKQAKKRYPLRGLPVTYIDPTEPVDKNEWEVLD